MPFRTGSRDSAPRISVERWQRISRIVDVALDLDTADRPACLDEQCAGDAELRADVEQFLAACEAVERSGDFLGEPAHRHAQPLADAIESQLASTRAALPAMVAKALAGRYEIRSELGTGGNATVFRALDLATGNVVAVKVLHAGLSQSIGSERFLREVRITSSLRHPNILPVLDAGVAGELLYYVMPCVSGQTLRERMHRERQLGLESAVGIARDVAAALDEAHEHGFVHRDVKPQNILLEGEQAFVADFGIARAMETAGADRLTETGALLGTPAYMSPEQAAGETTIDRRSDVYSLACVVYEMLVGEPPFSSTSTKAILAKQMLAPVPDVRVVRPSLPPAVNEVLLRALAKQPADRYESASAFVTALSHALAAPRVDRRQRWQLAASAASVLVVATVATALRVSSVTAVSAAPLDTTIVALLPLEHDDSSARASIDDDLLHESVSRWTGITPVDQFRVTDAVRQRGAVRTPEDATAIAQQLGAGHFVRGRVARRGGESRAYLALYDTHAGNELYHATSVVPTDPSAARRTYAQLVDSLLLHGADGSGSPIGKSTSRSLPAMQAARHARIALDDWELAAADSALQEALTFDVRDPWTNLWAAQVRAWEGLPTTTWSTSAMRAASGDTTLSSRERLLARALTALAGGEFAAACRTYDELRRENARDFAAWYGLGQCRRMDILVVRDASSPSRWRFRSSYDSALTAFTTAFEILPSALHAYEPGSFERLRDLLLLSTAVALGRSADSASFYARPGYMNNRVVLIPYPWQQVSSGDPSTIPPGFDRAITVQRDRFRKIAGTWSSAFPRSSAAKNAVALALELMRDPRAIDTIRAARRLATNSAQRTTLAAAEAFLLVKFGIADEPTLLIEASHLADSLLKTSRFSASVDSGTLAGLAVMRGSCVAAESFSRRLPWPEPVLQQYASQVSAATQAILIRAALGCTMKAGSLGTIMEAAVAALRPLPAAERARYLEALLYRPVLLNRSMDSAVVDQLGKASTNKLLLAARAYVRHDDVAARSSLNGFSSAWRETSGPVTPEVALPEARLYLALGDTTAAVLWMDRALAQVSAYDPEVLRDAATLASLIRLMILRTEVAARTRDEATARRWAPRVFALWSAADPELTRDLEPLRRFTRAP